MRCLWLALGLVVLGCEAPLNLGQVAIEQDRLLHRYDQFQAVADNGDTLVVVGSGGVVLTSLDRGETWRRMQLEDGPSLIAAAACPNGVFGLLDPLHRLWVSDDQGASWRSRSISGESTPLALTCDPLNRFWVVGGFSTFWMSSDQGATWREYSLGDDTQLTTVQFVDAQHGFVTGEFGTVLLSHDGGETWEWATALPGELYPQAAWFLGRLRGWVVGLNGKVMYTDDGANSWVAQKTESETSLFGLTSAGARLFAVGDHGTLWLLDGEQWRSLEHGQPAKAYLRAVHPVGETSLVVAGGSGALFRVDLGQHLGAPEKGVR